ncbi:MAG TPA: TonB-dependent receptor, partial [Candidatus Sulfotelmatobacter sp.]|nr:TonB-dependent receptor [Candidatus Sulfotelmatobacter sp.]
LTGFVSTPPPIYLCLCDDGKFVSETLLGYEAGYRRLITSRFYFDVAAFHNKYNDLESYGDITISLQPTPPPYSVLISLPYANGIQGSTNGGEIAPDWKATSRMEMRASYSYVTMDLEDKATQTKTSYTASYEDATPHHEAAAQVLFKLPKGIEFDPTYRYSGALPFLGVNSYSTVDARFGWHVAKSFGLSIVGQNLLQPRHAEAGPVLVERSAYAQLTWNSEK